MRLWTLGLCVGLLACSGAPGGGAATTAAADKSGPAPEDPALRAYGQGLVDELVAGLATCHALIDGADLAAAETDKMPFDAAALTAACGRAQGLYDANVEKISGKARPIDVLLGLAARVADDVDYVGRAIDDVGTERKLALEHLRDAMAKADDGITKWKDLKVFPYRVNYGGPKGAAQWERDVKNDGRDGVTLGDHLQRYAFGQGLNASQVRGRVLDTYGRTVSTYLPLRVAALETAGLPADQLAARQAYLSSYAAWLATYTRASEAFAGGKVADEAARAQLVAEAQASQAAWKAAWDVVSAAK